MANSQYEASLKKKKTDSVLQKTYRKFIDSTLVYE